MTSPVSLVSSASKSILVKLLSAAPVQKGEHRVSPIDDRGNGEGGAADSLPDVPGSTAAAVNRRDLVDLERDFAALMRRYQQPIYNIAVQLIGDEDEAGDVTQETFLSAYRARGSFRSESKVFTWLYRIAINHSKNRLKSRSRARSHEGPSLDSGFESADGDEQGSLLESGLVADWSQSPEILLEQGELRTKIREAIEALSHEYKSVLLLREMEEMNYNDIAEATGLTLEAVKTRISRARGMVRKRVAPYYSQQ
jgi:RNA polymerase sigma-70 factor, ECF subfamily